MSLTNLPFHGYAMRARGPLPFTASASFDTFVEAAYAEGLRQPKSKQSNPYALLDDTLSLLVALAEKLNPKLIVEFGSGASTHVLGAWASAHHSKLLSVEHDCKWAEQVCLELAAEHLPAVDIRHVPLQFTLRGFRQFFSYGELDTLIPQIASAKLMLLDGPHMSGREIVLRCALRHASPGAVLVIDDFHHHIVREMLADTPVEIAACFEGVVIEENSHGLYVLRCLRSAPAARFATAGLRAIAQSYWRCFGDFKIHGRGN